MALLAMPLLRDAGHSVTGVIRNPEHRHDIEEVGGKPLVLDLEWTILGPATLTFEKLTGTIDLAPLHDSAGERVSRGNVALTIRAALEMDETIGRTFEYVGGTTGIREAFRSRG